MADFTKAHLRMISRIRDSIDGDSEFRHTYQTNREFHAYVEWYCNTPGLKDAGTKNDTYIDHINLMHVLDQMPCLW